MGGLESKGLIPKDPPKSCGSKNAQTFSCELIMLNHYMDMVQHVQPCLPHHGSTVLTATPRKTQKNTAHRTNKNERTVQHVLSLEGYYDA